VQSVQIPSKNKAMDRISPTAGSPTDDEPSNVDALPDYEIVNFQCGVTTDSELTILCYGKRFHIHVSAEDLHRNPHLEKEYLGKLRKLEIEDGLRPIGYSDDQKTLVEELDDGDAEEQDDDDDDEPVGDAMEETCFWIAFKCNPYMRALRSDPEPVPRTVEDWFYPETLVLTLQVDKEGNLDVSSSPASDDLIADLISHVRLPAEMLENPLFPLVHPSKVFLCYDKDITGPIQRPEKVITDSAHVRFFKPCHQEHQIPREIRIMTRLQKSGLSKTLRVPTLYGLVQHQDEPDQICGLLLTYIEHRESLAFVDIQDTPLSLRKKWISQIKEAVKALHSAGIVWGDAKPENILVDHHDDLWLIDFGGSFTPGWVDEDKAETVEGDCQALERIIDYLLGKYEQNGASPEG
jgi:tRNA A-37 threonylcarbamoyl transferase component Bud32